MENKEPKRKYPRLKKYDYSKKGMYFLTICSKDRYKYFSQITKKGDCYISSLTDIGLMIENHISKIDGIYKYVIMPDHVHLLIEKSGTNGDIKKDINSFKTITSKKASFSLWQRSFFDHVIRNQQDLNEHIMYIENNPKSWYIKHLNQQ